MDTQIVTKSENEIIDGRTGEIIPHGANQVPETRMTVPKMESVGTLEISETAQVVFAESLGDEEVKIRPDGNLYLPWTWYASRLNKAFGVAQWGLIPEGMPMSKPHGQYGDVLVAWGHWLVVKGIPIGFAIGETTYKPSNAMMSYADACEGAKSNSLARNCKLLGMSLDLWDGDYCETWKEKYAEQYTNPKTNKKEWRKRKTGNQPKPQPATPINTQATQPPENINQETGDLSEPVELINPMDSWAVQYAAKFWNIEPAEAAKAIASKKLGFKIDKRDFVKIVEAA